MVANPARDQRTPRQSHSSGSYLETGTGGGRKVFVAMARSLLIFQKAPTILNPARFMNNKYISWIRKHPIWTTLIVLFIISLAVPKTPSAPSTPASESAQVQETETSVSETRDTAVKTSNTQAPSVTKTETPKATVPAEYRSALNKAGSYANTMHMSKRGVYDQLTSEYGEKFSVAAAQYAIDNVRADWNANALVKAKTYQNTMSMSPAAIRDQLVSEHGEKFTQAEADYAILHLND